MPEAPEVFSPMRMTIRRTTVERTTIGSIVGKILRTTIWLVALTPLAATADIDLGDAELESALALKIRTVRHMALNPTLVRAVRRQNAEGIAPAEIATRDERWKGTDELTQFKWTLQQTRAGRFLRDRVKGDPAYNEAFLTDNQGANVAAFPPTSDYFQGDEEKWSESFNDGSGRVFIGPVELDESTGVRAVQISAPVLDKGRTIGVLVVGITVEHIESRQSVAQSQ